MRAPEKKKIPKPKPVNNTDDKLVALAVDSAKQSAQSAKDSAELAKLAIESNNIEDMRKALIQLSSAISEMAAAMDNTFRPIRVVPRRDSRGLAESYDVLPLTKVVH